MKQATIIEIAESCKVTRNTAWRWAKKAGVKISSIKRKLAEATPHRPAIFNEDELICILSDNYVKIKPTPVDVESVVTKETNSLSQKRQSLTLDQRIKIAELIVRMMELSERTRPNMQLDYHLNIAKKRLSGLAANDKYTPAMNLLEAPNNEEE